jgi:hypothetical protein
MSLVSHQGCLPAWHAHHTLLSPVTAHHVMACLDVCHRDERLLEPHAQPPLAHGCAAPVVATVGTGKEQVSCWVPRSLCRREAGSCVTPVMVVMVDTDG